MATGISSFHPDTVTDEGVAAFVTEKMMCRKSAGIGVNGL
jgi:hypothetical protein